VLLIFRPVTLIIEPVAADLLFRLSKSPSLVRRPPGSENFLMKADENDQEREDRTEKAVDAGLQMIKDDVEITSLPDLVRGNGEILLRLIKSDHQGLDMPLSFLGLSDGQVNAPELHSGQRNRRLEA
jgi:hypothetical protein